MKKEIFKVGDKVKCVNKEYNLNKVGKVVRLDNDDYPTVVQFNSDSRGLYAYFTADGKYFEDGEQVLFLNNK